MSTPEQTPGAVAEEAGRDYLAAHWTDTAQDMLTVWDAWFGGNLSARKGDAHRLLTAGSFAAQAYDDALRGPAPDGAPGVLMRTFLVALIDWRDRQLDPLRAGNLAPSAPVEVAGLVDRLRGVALCKLEAAIGPLAFDCTRVWEAWSVGTMGPDDFEPVNERIDELVDEAISPFVSALEASHAASAAKDAEIARLTAQAENDAETMKGVRKWLMEGDTSRALLWINDGLSGYTDTAENTLSEAIARAERAEAALAEERANSDALAKTGDDLLGGLKRSVCGTLSFPRWDEAIDAHNKLREA